MFDSHSRLLAPPDGTPIRPWFADAPAFIALHPFFVVEGLDPADCEYETLILSAAERPVGRGLVEWTDDQRAARRRGKEFRFASVHEAAKNFGEPIRWGTMCRQLGFADHRDIDRALRTHIGGLKDGFSDPSGADRLVQSCAQSKVFLPTEGVFQAVMEPPLVALLRDLDVDEIEIGGEFGEQAQRIAARDMSRPESWAKSRPRRIAAIDETIVLATPWDSFFTIIVGRRDRLSAMLPRFFEGFWCSGVTTSDWCLEPLIPLVS